MSKAPNTYILDIDGLLLKHHGKGLSGQLRLKPALLRGTLEKLAEWEAQGCSIIFLTGRKESMRAATVRQLEEAGLYYDVLVMGVGGGDRHLVNDCKPDGRIAAFAHNILRNVGIGEVDF